MPEDQYSRAIIEAVADGIAESLEPFVEMGLKIDADDLHDHLDAAPFDQWEKALAKFMAPHLDQLIRDQVYTIDTAFTDVINARSGISPSEERDFWDDVYEQMEGRRFEDLYDVVPDMLDTRDETTRKKER